MLVLARGIDEGIFIGDNIRIIVTQVRNKAGKPEVRLGIDAPDDMEVWREEIYYARRAQAIHGRESEAAD